MADNSIYNRKLGLEVHIKKKGGLGRRARGRASSATPNRISSFHVASFLCISLFLSFLYDVVQRNGVFYFVFKNLKALKCMRLFLFFKI